MKRVISLLSVLVLGLGLGIAASSTASAYGACPGTQSQITHQRIGGSATVKANRNGTWWTVAAPSNGGCGSQIRVTSWQSGCSNQMYWSVDGIRNAAKTVYLNTTYTVPKSHNGKVTVATNCW